MSASPRPIPIHTPAEIPSQASQASSKCINVQIGGCLQKALGAFTPGLSPDVPKSHVNVQYTQLYNSTGRKICYYLHLITLDS